MPLGCWWSKWCGTTLQVRALWVAFQTCRPRYWFSLVSITTVGYGDVVPTQPLGKILAAIVMIFGILVIALPITVIGSNFSNMVEPSHLSPSPEPSLKLLTQTLTLTMP